MKEDLTVFTHLLGDDGTLVGQHDGQPCNVNSLGKVWAPIEKQYTSQWKPGKLVRDVHYIQVAPDGAEEGSVLIGFYHPESGDRLPTSEGGTAINLGRFQIAR